MPYTLLFEPAKTKGVKLDVRGDHGEAHKRIRETFGTDPDRPTQPTTLRKVDAMTLRAMGQDPVLQKLADEVEAHGEIRVWGVGP